MMITNVSYANRLFNSGQYVEALCKYIVLSDKIGSNLFKANIHLCKNRIIAKKYNLYNSKSIIFASDHTFIPHRAGGRESSINDLAIMFVNNGWNVIVLAHRPKKKENINRDISFPYSVILSENIFLEVKKISQKLNPDIIIASVDGINIPKFLQDFPDESCLFVRDNQCLDNLYKGDTDKFIFFANSSFVASEVEKRINRFVPFFPPYIDIQQYKTNTTREFITFINPVEKKGVEVAIEIAQKMPNRSFLFCEGWPLSDAQWDKLESICARHDNVILERRTVDMKKVYSRTKLLIVPSQWEEAWGRVVTESHVNGIPTIVNDVGGLRESCGVGGIVMSRNSKAEDWVAELSKIINNPTLYEHLSNQAKLQSNKYVTLVSNCYSQINDALDDQRHRCRRFVQKISEDDFAHSIYISLKSNNIDQAIFVSQEALSELPFNYKGFFLPDRFKSLNIKTPEWLHKEHKSNKTKPIICSWPGTLSGNRYMDEFRSQFEQEGYNFLPIRMPSDGVVYIADLLIIQWPDVIKWRNNSKTKSSLQEIMLKEIDAIKEWKKAGVRIVWIVHNLLPHDLLEEDYEVWSDFYHQLGYEVDSFASMFKSADGIIKENIPSLSNKPYHYFFHPFYKIKKFNSTDIHRKRLALGLQADSLLISILGGIKKYKGIKDVLTSFIEISTKKFFLLIAGKCSDKELSDYIGNIALKANNIIFYNQFIDNNEFDLLANCTDKFIVPNKDYLNSGALIYAISANKPTLALRKPFSEDLRSKLLNKNLLKLVEKIDCASLNKFIITKDYYPIIELEKFSTQPEPNIVNTLMK